MIEEIVGARRFSARDYEGGIGDANFAFDADPEVIPGAVSGGILNYVVLDHEIRRPELRLLEAGMRVAMDDAVAEAIAEDLDSDADVELIDTAGQQSLAVYYTVNDSGFTVSFEIIFVPVGNTFVIGTVAISDFGDVPRPIIEPVTIDFTLAGIAHLGRIAEDPR